MSRIVLDEVKDFNLEHIFDCGQCFRWNEDKENRWWGKKCYENVTRILRMYYKCRT